jgi:hypothetical protein
MPISVAARSNAWVCVRSLAGIAGSNSAGGMFVLVNVLRCQVEVSVTDRSLVQRSPTEYVSFSVIRCNSNPLHLQWVGRRGQTKKHCWFGVLLPPLLFECDSHYKKPSELKIRLQNNTKNSLQIKRNTNTTLGQSAVNTLLRHTTLSYKKSETYTAYLINIHGQQSLSQTSKNLQRNTSYKTSLWQR